MPLFFDGVTGVVTYSNADLMALINGATKFTMMCWAMPRTLAVNRPFLARNQASGNVFGMRIAQGDAAASAVLVLVGDGVGGANFGETASGKLAVGLYTHVAFAFNGAGATNAQRLQAVINGVNEPLSFTGTIGAALPTITADLKVSVDDVTAFVAHQEVAFIRAYTAHLTPEEIKTEMEHYTPQRTDDLVLCSILDDLDAIALDYSGRGFHGSIVGAPASGPFALMPPVSF